MDIKFSSFVFFHINLLKESFQLAPRNPPFLLWADICFLLMFISTPVLSALLILFICVFVNNNGKFPLSWSFFSLIVIGDLFLYALAKFAFCPSVKLTEYDLYDILYKIW